MGAEKVQQKKKGRPTMAETENRVSTVYQLMIDGLDRSRILQFVAENWGLTERSADYYIAKAREKFLEALRETENKDVMKMYIFKRLENLYSLNMENCDLKEARAVLADASKIFGVNAPEEIKQEVNDVSDNKNPIVINFVDPNK